MRNRTTTGLMSMVAAAVLAVGLAPGTAVAHDDGHGRGGDSDKSDDWRQSSEQRKLVRTLRGVTADYHRLQNAIDDGYEKASECVEKADGSGAMGFHYLKKDLLDDKTQARKPEVLVYMPNDHGRMKLVAVEFLSTAKDRPEIAGLDFEKGPFPDSWALHAWVWKDNPDGMFAAYNPDHSCPK